MNKEMDEEQVQDHLRDEETGGGGYHSAKPTKGEKAIFWITLAVMIGAVIAIILFAT